MKICAISDTHSKHNDLNIEPCDILIHAGDITYFSKKDSEVTDFLEWFHNQPAKYKIFCAGNHDFSMQFKGHIFKKMMKHDIVYLNDELIEIEGIKIWGSPVTPFFHGWAFNKNRGEEIKKTWDKIPENIDILITHGPPKGILDISNNDNVGCEDLLIALNKIKPTIHIFGHIHQSYGKVVKTFDDKEITFYNASACNDSYKIINQPHYFEFSKT